MAYFPDGKSEEQQAATQQQQLPPWMGNKLQGQPLDEALETAGYRIVLIYPFGRHRERKAGENDGKHEQCHPSLDPHARP
jgi:hypothetical protein